MSKGGQFPSVKHQFKPGWEGGPGRPRGSVSITKLLREAASKIKLCTQPIPENLTAAEALAEAMYYHAIQGNASYAKEILERIDGKVADVIKDDREKAIRAREAIELAKLRKRKRKKA